MSGIGKMSKALQILRMRAGDAAKGLDETTDAAKELGKGDVGKGLDDVTKGTKRAKEDAKEVEEVLKRISLRSGSGSSATTGGGSSSSGGGTSGPGAADDRTLIERLSQQDVISRLQGTKTNFADGGGVDIGAYLEKYVELYMELLVKGADRTLTPRRQRVIEEALYRRDIGAQDIIRRFGGTEGKKLNFSQLESDIKKLLRAQQDVARAAKRSGTTSTTGTTGRTKTEACSQPTALSILQQSGALR